MTGARRYLALVAASARSEPALAMGVMTWAVAVFLVTIAQPGGFQPGLGDPLNYALTATAFLGPVAGGAAAHHVAGMGCARLLDLGRTSPRGAGAQVRLAIVATLAWSLAALGSMHAILLVAADLSGAKTPSMLLLPAASVGIVLLCVSAGALCGTRWPSVLTAPSVTLACFAWVYVIAFDEGKAGRLAPIYPDVFYNDAIEPNVLLVGAQVGAMAGLSALAVAATWRGWTRVVLALLGASIVVASGFAWHGADPEATQLRNPPASIPCATEGAVSLCYWPESSHQARHALRALSDVHDRLQGVFEPPTRFAQRGLTSRFPESRELLIPRHENPDYAYRAVLAVVPPLTCHNERVYEAHRQLVNLFTAMTDAGPISEDTQPILDLPKDRIRTWVASQVEIIEGCSTR